GQSRGAPPAESGAATELRLSRFCPAGRIRYGELGARSSAANDPQQPRTPVPRAFRCGVRGLPRRSSRRKEVNLMKAHRISYRRLVGLMAGASVLGLMVAAVAFAAAPAPPAQLPPPETYVTHPYIGEAESAPLKAIAGKPFTVTFHVTDRSNGQDISKTDMMLGKPTINGVLVRPHVEKLVNGKASVSLTVPKSAKGKTLALRLTVKVGDRTDSRIVDYRIS